MMQRTRSQFIVLCLEEALNQKTPAANTRTGTSQLAGRDDTSAKRSSSTKGTRRRHWVQNKRHQQLCICSTSTDTWIPQTASLGGTAEGLRAAGQAGELTWSKHDFLWQITSVAAQRRSFDTKTEREVGQRWKPTSISSFTGTSLVLNVCKDQLNLNSANFYLVQIL